MLLIALLSFYLNSFECLKHDGVESLVVFDSNGLKCVEGVCFTDDSLVINEVVINNKVAIDYTSLYIFTRENGLHNFSTIHYNNVTSVKTSSFNVNKTTKVIVHGWKVSANGTFEKGLRKTYLKNQDVNVIEVDWSPKAETTSYYQAIAAVTSVGRFLALVLDWLVKEVGLSLDAVHLIGHSLGAHIAGVAGENVKNGKISRITGLDPAGPLFIGRPSRSGRLDSSDAQFVDVIHTCAGFLGFKDPCGHVDFFPNDGTYFQPGCVEEFFKSLPFACSHSRSYEFFDESISSKRFLARACDSWTNFGNKECENNNIAVMGDSVNTSARGRFFLRTASSSPFALG